MNKKKLLSFLLAVQMGVSTQVPVLLQNSLPVLAQSQSISHGWYYDHLQSVASRNIYDLIASNLSVMEVNGKADLFLDGIYSQKELNDYLNGNRQVSIDFLSARDAFNLDHPEAWWLDTSRLALRIGEENGQLKAKISIGSSSHYYTASWLSNASLRQSMQSQIDQEIARIITATASQKTTAARVAAIHDEIIRSISYTTELEARDDQSADMIRTVYALVDHQGVCEGYARSLQIILNQLGIENVLIHGVQKSGTPQNHMWNAVKAEDGNWYLVDATFDDPRPAGSKGDGLDGAETSTYLLAGKDITLSNWVPSGEFSQGSITFQIPEISDLSYGKQVSSYKGLKVEATNSTLEGLNSMQYKVTYNGMNLHEMEKNGIYLLSKMYQVGVDGTVHEFDGWYYVMHGLLAMGKDGFGTESGNEYFYDGNDGLVYNMANIDYFELAVTTAPHETWKEANDLLKGNQGWYTGDGSDIIAQTGKIANAKGGYRSAPQVSNMQPLYLDARSKQVLEVEFNDIMYRPSLNDIKQLESLASSASTQSLSQEEIDQAMKNGDLAGQIAQMKKALYSSADALSLKATNYSWMYEGKQDHVFSKQPVYQITAWHWADGTRSLNNAASRLGNGEGVTGVTIELIPSDQWADDSVTYSFSLDGLVGKRSNKLPYSWSYVVENPPLSNCRLSTGVDWNQWGHPNLLNTEDLDLNSLLMQNGETLAALEQRMKGEHPDFFSRLMLVVEDLTPNQVAELDPLVPESISTDSKTMAYEISFSRVCQNILASIKDGNSVRIQMGYPLGYDATSNVIYTAYHFNRNEKGEVISVNKIPVQMTPYGLVILCDSFSPFVLAASPGSISNEHPGLIVTHKGNGTITLDGKDATSQVYDLNKTLTFKVNPGNGAVLDSVNYTGKAIQVDKQNGTITVYPDSDVAGCQVLEVGFIDQAYKASEGSFEPKVVDASNVKQHPASEITGRVAIEKGSLSADGKSLTLTADADFSQAPVSITWSALSKNQEVEISTGPSVVINGYLPLSSQSEANRAVSYKVTCKFADGSERMAEITDYALVNHWISGNSAISLTLDEVKEVGNKLGEKLISLADLKTEYVLPEGISIEGELPDQAGVFELKFVQAGSPVVTSLEKFVRVQVTNPQTDEEKEPLILSDETSENEDGSVTRTITQTDGTVSRSTSKDGKLTLTQIELSAASDGTIAGITLPADLKDNSVKVEVVTPAAKMLKIHASGIRPGSVAMIETKDGSLEPVILSYGKNGIMYIPVEDDCTLVLKDNAKFFPDHPETDWDSDGIDFCSARGILNGYEDGTFASSAPVTRGQMARILWNMSGQPEVTSNVFSDIPVYAYYLKAATWTALRGYMTGYENGSFAGDDPLTREQMATVLYRRSGKPTPTGSLNIFADGSNHGTFSEDALKWAVGLQLIKGQDNTWLNATGVGDRGQIATILYRYLTR